MQLIYVTVIRFIRLCLKIVYRKNTWWATVISFFQAINQGKKTTKASRLNTTKEVVKKSQKLSSTQSLKAQSNYWKWSKKKHRDGVNRKNFHEIFESKCWQKKKKKKKKKAKKKKKEKKKKKKKRNLMATIHHIERSHNKLILL